MVIIGLPAHLCNLVAITDIDDLSTPGLRHRFSIDITKSFGLKEQDFMFCSSEV